VPIGESKRCICGPPPEAEWAEGFPLCWPRRRPLVRRAADGRNRQTGSCQVL